MLKLLSAELNGYQRALVISGSLRALILTGVGLALLRNTPFVVIIIYGVGFVLYILMEFYSVSHKHWMAARLVAYAEEEMKIPIYEPGRRKIVFEDEPEQSIERKE